MRVASKVKSTGYPTRNFIYNQNKNFYQGKKSPLTTWALTPGLWVVPGTDKSLKTRRRLFRWCFTMSKKTGSDQASMETVIDAKARSGRTLRFLKTDGDGVFNSGSFEELRVKFGFIHEKSARMTTTGMRKSNGRSGQFLKGLQRP